MELGIFARTFARASVESNLDAIVEHGLTVAQYNLACAGLPTLPDAVQPGLARRVRAEATVRGIRIAAVSGTFNMIDPNLERRRDGLRRLRVLAAACADLGTRTITLCTGTRDPDDMWRGHADNTTTEAWAELLTSMEAALDIADEFDLVLGIEPETANVVNSAIAARRLLRELRAPRLKIVIDPANLFNVGDLPNQQFVLYEAFDVLFDDIVMAHAKDVVEIDGAIRHVPAGTGQLDYSHYLTLLDSLDAPLIVHGLEESEVPWSLAFLRARSLEVGTCLSYA